MINISITQTLLFITAILGMVMQYKYSDKRTKVFKRLRNIFFIATVITYPTGLLVTRQDYIDNQHQIYSVNHNFDSVKLRLDSSNSKLNFTKSQLQILDARTQKLSNQLTPFLELASKKYPKLNPDSALDKLRITIINKTYINNGPAKRLIRGSSDSIIEALQKQPKGAYQLYYLTNDPEAYNLAIELDNTLVKAGWQTIPPILLINKPGLKGITVYVSKEQEPMITFVNRLSNALGNRGVGVSMVSEEKLNQIAINWNQINVIPMNVPTALIFIGTNPDNQ
jgi:hypothetical protein